MTPISTSPIFISGFIGYFPPVFVDYISKYYDTPLKIKDSEYQGVRDYAQHLSNNKKFTIDYDINALHTLFKNTPNNELIEVATLFNEINRSYEDKPQKKIKESIKNNEQAFVDYQMNLPTHKLNPKEVEILYYLVSEQPPKKQKAYEESLLKAFKHFSNPKQKNTKITKETLKDCIKTLDMIKKDFKDDTINKVSGLNDFVQECDNFIYQYNYTHLQEVDKKEKFVDKVKNLLGEYKTIDKVLLQQILLQDENYKLLSFLVILSQQENVGINIEKLLKSIDKLHSGNELLFLLEKNLDNYYQDDLSEFNILIQNLKDKDIKDVAETITPILFYIENKKLFPEISLQKDSFNTFLTKLNAYVVHPPLWKDEIHKYLNGVENNKEKSTEGRNRIDGIMKVQDKVFPMFVTNSAIGNFEFEGTQSFVHLSSLQGKIKDKCEESEWNKVNKKYFTNQTSTFDLLKDIEPYFIYTQSSNKYQTALTLYAYNMNLDKKEKYPHYKELCNTFNVLFNNQKELMTHCVGDTIKEIKKEIKTNGIDNLLFKESFNTRIPLNETYAITIYLMILENEFNVNQLKEIINIHIYKTRFFRVV